MRITKTNGEIIECSADEYKIFMGIVNVKNEVETMIYNESDAVPELDELTDDAVKPEIKIKYVDKKYADKKVRSYLHHRMRLSNSFREWSKKEDDILRDNDTRTAYKLLDKYRSISAIRSRRKMLRQIYGFNYLKVIEGNHKKRFTCNRWTKKEDKIIKTNMELSVDKLHKLLPDRSIQALYVRKSNIKLHHVKSRKKNLNPNDKRVKMMRYIGTVGQRLLKNNPEMSHKDAMKTAMQQYRQNKDTIQQ